MSVPHIDTRAARVFQQEPHNCRELTACVIAVVSAAAAIFGFLLNSQALIVYAVIGGSVALGLYLCSRIGAHSPTSSSDGRITPPWDSDHPRTFSTEPRPRRKQRRQHREETRVILYPSPLLQSKQSKASPTTLSLDSSLNPPLGPPAFPAYPPSLPPLFPGSVLSLLTEINSPQPPDRFQTTQEQTMDPTFPYASADGRPIPTTSSSFGQPPRRPTPVPAAILSSTRPLGRDTVALPASDPFNERITTAFNEQVRPTPGLRPAVGSGTLSAAPNPQPAQPTPGSRPGVGSAALSTASRPSSHSQERNYSLAGWNDDSKYDLPPPWGDDRRPPEDSSAVPALSWPSLPQNPKPVIPLPLVAPTAPVRPQQGPTPGSRPGVGERAASK